MKQYKLLTVVCFLLIVLSFIAIRMNWRVVELEEQLDMLNLKQETKERKSTVKEKVLSSPSEQISTITNLFQPVLQPTNKYHRVLLDLPHPKPQANSSLTNLLSDARFAMKRKAYDKAKDLLWLALQLESDPEGKQQIRALLAESMAATQDLDGAVTAYEEYLEAATSDQERVLGLTQMAAVLSLAKRFDEAEALLANPGLIGDDPAMRQAILHAKLRLWQARPGRLDQVAAELEAKVAANPPDRESLELLGTIYLKVQRNYDKAKPVYEKLLSQETDNAGLQNTLIGIYRETRDYAKARDLYERYLVSHPKEADGIRFQIAALYIQSGQGDEGVAYAEKYLNGAEATVEQKEQVARIYEFSGRLDDAVKTLREAETVAQDTAKKAELRLRQSDLLIRQKKYGDAEALARRILFENGSDKEIKVRANQELIRIYQVQGKLGELKL